MEATMKVSNNQKPTKDDDGVARETLNDWQKHDTRVRREADDTNEHNDSSRKRSS